MPDASPPDPDGWGAPRLAPIPFETFRAELLGLYVPPLRAKATASGIRTMLGELAKLLGPDATTAGLTPALVARLVATRPPELSPYSVRSLLVKVKIACNYAVSQGYLRSSPFAFRKHWIRVGGVAQKRHHSRGDIRRVLDLLAAEVRDREGWPRWRARRLQALAATLAYTGLRAQEALGLTVDDVDLPGRMLLVVPRAGNRLKTVASAQPVPIPEALAPILAGWLTHRMDQPEAGFKGVPDCPWVFANVTRTNRWKDGPTGHRPLDQLKAAGLRAGVEGFTMLSLRHSWATHAESWGLGPAMIQRVLRHASLDTQKHYRHADCDNLRRAVGGIDFGIDFGADGTPPAAPGGGPTP